MTPAHPIVCFIASLVVLVVAGWTRPDRAECPERGWYIELRRDRCDGCFECRPISPVRTDSRGHEPDPPLPRGYDVHVDGAIECTGGQKPIVVNHRKVGCQRGGWEE